jgi:dinuclear metal center YbgI/SA1388 family protein
MITLTQLQKFLDGYMLYDKKLNVEKIDPFMTNGLMIKGNEDIKKIGFGVSASISLFERAKEAGYDALIVHHTFNIPQINRFDSIFQNRIGFLIKNGISLFGYHFLLDAHPEIGNNSMILKTLGANLTKPYLLHDSPWGWTGVLTIEKTLDEIKEIYKPFLSQRTKIYDFGPKKIKRVVACSGKGAPPISNIQRLIDEKIDLYITGEVHEWIRELFREAKINFIAGGHYSTEVFGIKTFMEKVKNEFDSIDCEWIDLENDI